MLFVRLRGSMINFIGFVATVIGIVTAPISATTEIIQGRNVGDAIVGMGKSVFHGDYGKTGEERTTTWIGTKDSCQRVILESKTKESKRFFFFFFLFFSSSCFPFP